MSLQTKLYLTGAIALIGVGVYLDRKYASAGGAGGIVSSLGSIVWDNATNAASNAVGAALDALPASQVPAVVDMAGPKPDISTLLYESALMGGGS